MIDRLKERFSSSGAQPRHVTRPGLLRRFNPYDFSDEQVARQATGREALLDRIMRVIRANAAMAQPPNQHLLVLAPRGMGKSFLVRMVQLATHALKDGPVVFARLSEEQLNVSAPELLLEEIRRVLERRPPEEVRVRWNAGSETEWTGALARLRETIAGLPGFADDRGLVVVSIENFDLLIEDVFAASAAQSRLRDLLANEPRLMLLATATKPADEDADKRLFQAFQREHIAPWKAEDFVTFYARAFLDRGEIDGALPALRAKILALAQFLGGAPRLAVLIGDILHTNDALSAVETLDQLVDELTPYYQDRILNRLKPKPRWLLDEPAPRPSSHTVSGQVARPRSLKTSGSRIASSHTSTAVAT